MARGLVAVVSEGDRWVAVQGATTAPDVLAHGAIAADTLASIEHAHAPRWVWWSQETAALLVAHGIRPARCWDLAATHGLLHGGGPADPARVWATTHGLDHDTIPDAETPTLFAPAAQRPLDDGPVGNDGHLDPDWCAGGWTRSDQTMREWAGLALRACDAQRALLAARGHGERTAHAESAAALLCAELEQDGLPIDVAAAERALGEIIGPRPTDARDAARQAAERDAIVLERLPAGMQIDLRNPAHVKSMLRRAGIEVPDTRAWRLEALRDESPVVDALLRWRKAERIATTFGYRWLDEHVGDDGRLRGRWTPSDGAAGRMTATAGLHNLPSMLRTSVAAEAGHVFVRADLGQIEPRVLAAVSGDRALIRATADDDLYAPVAERLGVTRDVAKVAVLGAMYGQTTGHGAAALASLEREYPVAMGFLRRADEAAQGGHDLETAGGRRIRVRASVEAGTGDRVARSRAAARGRYGRNAVVQGAAAEFFKTWAALVRAGCGALSAQIVLCLHDELLVHVPERHADAAASLVRSSLQQVPSQWGPAHATSVRFVADVTVVRRWADAD